MFLQNSRILFLQFFVLLCSCFLSKPCNGMPFSYGLLHIYQYMLLGEMWLPWQKGKFYCGMELLFNVCLVLEFPFHFFYSYQSSSMDMVTIMKSECLNPTYTGDGLAPSLSYGTSFLSIYVYLQRDNIFLL